MAVPFAVVGPGRVGASLARAWQRGGFDCLGFVDRPESDGGDAREACAFVGAGRVLQPAELVAATVVLIAVTDDAFTDCVAGLARDAEARPCSLWLSSSGAHGAATLQSLRDSFEGVRVGGFHPLCPIPDRAQAAASLRGAPVLVEVADSARRLAERLATAAGLIPVFATVADRARYHAACVLAANGTTALLDGCERLLVTSSDLDAASARRVATALARAAVERVAAVGPAAALSGPVLRGDAALVGGQLRALRGADPVTGDLYRAVQRTALDLALRRGLDAAAAARLAAALEVDTGD